MPDHWVVWAIIGLALAFDYVNGFHDAANSIATVVSTRVMKPHWAVAWAAFFNFIAFLFFGLAVATTIGKGIVTGDSITVPVITAGLVGAIVWDLVTWWLGLPTSSSHALVGGFAGAAVAYKGFDSLKAYQTIDLGFTTLSMPGVVKIGIFIPLAPILGLLVGGSLMVATYWIFRHSTPGRVGGIFKRLQLVSAAAYSLGHGGNDAQKTMGIILALLIASYPGKYDVPAGKVVDATEMATCEYSAPLEKVAKAAEKTCKDSKFATEQSPSGADTVEIRGTGEAGAAVAMTCRRLEAGKTSVAIRGSMKADGRKALHGSLLKKLQPDIPLWIILACHAAMGLGTMFGGWRIVKTMGQKICHLQPVHGFSAETGGALCLYGATWLGIPVSTTHTITGAILGVGSTRGIKSVRWAVAGRVVWAWVLTIPASALIAAGTWWLFRLGGWN